MKEPGELAYEAFWCGPLNWHILNDDSKGEWARVEAAIRADERAAIEAAGYVVVPKIPTEAMIENAIIESPATDSETTRIVMRRSYRAMIAAATPSPAAPVSPSGPGQSDGTSD